MEFFLALFSIVWYYITNQHDTNNAFFLPRLILTYFRVDLI